MSLVDANSAGFVHGGTVMKLCDEAAGLAAIKHSRRRVVTAGMDRMTFNEPVHIAELVTFKAGGKALWGPSLEVGGGVGSENPPTGVVRHPRTADLTMVALVEERRPTAAPPLTVASADERRREREAQTRRRNRLAEREELLRARHH